MSNLKKLLNPDDVTIIDATNATNWVPKDPAEVILPYLKEEEENEDLTDVEKRLEKAKNVVDGYTEVINQCRILEAQIEQRCKAVTVTLDKSTQLRVIEAMGRVFGVETDQITFEHYKRCIEELANLNDQATPSLGNLS